MTTIELREEAIQAAELLGYTIRQEWLDGSGGACQFGGKRWIFLDVSLSTSDQLDQLVEALLEDPRVAQLNTSATLSQLLGRRQAA